MAEPSVHNTPYSKASRRGLPIVGVSYTVLHLFDHAYGGKVALKGVGVEV